MPQDPPHWRACLERGEFEHARIAWALAWSGRETDLEASWIRAEIEERAGDARLVTDGLAAKRHYHDAWQTLQSSMTRIWQVHHADRAAGNAEAMRRQEAFDRCYGKFSAIGSQGTVAGDRAALPPHPASAPFLAGSSEPALAQSPPPSREAAADTPRMAAPPDVPPIPASPDVPSIPASPDVPPIPAPPLVDPPIAESALAKITLHDDHWQQLAFGQHWADAGDAVAERHPALAARAFEWSLLHYERYTQLWTAHLPASRFDSDGRMEAAQIWEKRTALPARGEAEAAPPFATRLLAGDVRGALDELVAAPAPPFSCLWDLLCLACRGVSDPQIRKAIERREAAWGGG